MKHIDNWMRALRVLLRVAGFVMLLTGALSLFGVRMSLDLNFRHSIYSELSERWTLNQNPRTFTTEEMSAVIRQAAGMAETMSEKARKSIDFGIWLIVAGGLLLGIVSFFPTKRPD